MNAAVRRVRPVPPLSGSWAGSSDAHPQVVDEAALFQTPAQIYEGAGDVDWVVPGLIAHGAVTNLDAKPKVGKTTFALMLIAAALDPHRRFLGREVEFDAVIYLTEQGADSFREQLARAGIGRTVVGRIHIVPFGTVHSSSWPDMLEIVRRRIETQHQGKRVLLVIDTFSKWSRVADENEATAVMAAYRPLLRLTQDLHLATLVIRHARKGDHEDMTDTARGSNAASGEADIILSLARPRGRPANERGVRTLRGVGRFDGIPEELSIEITAGEYIVLLEGEALATHHHQQLIADHLTRTGALTIEAIAESTGIARTSIQIALAALTRPPVATVVRTGTGMKGDPHRYARIRDAAAKPPANDGSPAAGREHAAGTTPTGFPAASGARFPAGVDGFPAASTVLPRNPPGWPPAQGAVDDPERPSPADIARAWLPGYLAADGEPPWPDEPGDLAAHLD